MFLKPSEGKEGFTLIEVISSLVILSVLAATIIPRYLELGATANLKAIDLGVSELNGRETLTWALVKMSNTGYQTDIELWGALVSGPTTNIDEYVWTSGPDRTSGGTLRYKDQVSAAISRAISSKEHPGRWGR